MRRTRQAALKTCPAIVRPFLAAALLCCVLSGALPAEAVMNPQGLMACCRGVKGAAGECHGDSCPMRFGEPQKPAGRVQHDPVCGAERALRAAVRTPAPAPRDYFEQEPSHERARAEVEHEHGRSVSRRNTPGEQRPAVGVASLGKPCPSDCCGAVAVSFAGLRRPKQAAALTDGLRPRPPTVEPHRRATPGRLKATSAQLRSHPPRAPPAGPHSRTS